MCVFVLRIIFACLSKAWYDPERVSSAVDLYTTRWGEPVVFIGVNHQRTTKYRGTRWTVIDRMGCYGLDSSGSG
jgi:hypothetical protein